MSSTGSVTLATKNEKDRINTTPNDPVPAPTTTDTEVEQGAAHTVSRKQPRSPLRKYALLVLFCFSRFLDAFNISALYPAIPRITEELNLRPSESVWMLSAYQLTFSSFLLVSGRISDIYNAKHSFIAGILALGIICLAVGFAEQRIAILVLRALSGIAASLTIPSSLSLIVHLFPEPQEQSIAIGAFTGMGAIGNVLGLILGAIFVQYTSWPWIFWFTALFSVPTAFVCILLIPRPESRTTSDSEGTNPTGLDLVGVSLLTVACLLFIFSMTSASTAGWHSAMVIAPLIISVFIAIAFFLWEAYIPEKDAALPPRMWRYPNFGVIIGVALVPVLWFLTVYLLSTSLWQDVFGWSAIKTAVHFIPSGIAGFPVMVCTGLFNRFGRPKWMMLIGTILAVAASALLPFASTPDRYWSFFFPAFVIGTIGASIAYVNMSIAIFRATPAKLAGTVGAVFTAALQLGAAVGSPIMTAIQSSVEEQNPNDPYAGRAAAYWFLFGITVLQGLAIAIFYRHHSPSNSDQEDSQPSAGRSTASSSGSEPGPKRE